MHKPSYYIVNGITRYRLLVAPVLIYLIVIGNIDAFKWLLGVSFFTDAIDGYLARKYKATSVMGSRLDSVADDLTIVAAIVGMLVFFPQFIKDHAVTVGVMLVLYVAQLLISLIKYGKISSFHVYSAKVAAVLQGVFLILSFFMQPIEWLFYAAAIITIVDLLEELILTLMLPEWKADVKGLYWVWKPKRTA